MAAGLEGWQTCRRCHRCRRCSTLAAPLPLPPLLLPLLLRAGKALLLGQLPHDTTSQRGADRSTAVIMSGRGSIARLAEAAHRGAATAGRHLSESASRHEASVNYTAAK